MPESYPYGVKVLRDAMQAKKAFGPSAVAAMAEGTRAGRPSALAMAKTAGMFDATKQRGTATLSKALSRSAAPHGTQGAQRWPTP